MVTRGTVSDLRCAALQQNIRLPNADHVWRSGDFGDVSIELPL